MLAVLCGAVACGGHALPADKGPAAGKAAERRQEPARAPGHVDDHHPTPARSIAVTMHPVATRRGAIGLHRLSDGEIALSGGLLLARGRDGALAQDGSWLAGLPSAEPAVGWRIHALGGRGDNLWLTVSRPTDDAPELAVRRRKGGAWVTWEPGPEDPGARLVDYTVWPEGQGIALALRPGGPPRLDVIDEDGARISSLRFEAAGLTGAPRPTALAGLGSGELFVALAADEGRMAGLLRWGPRESTPGFAPLPGIGSRVPRQVAVLVEGDGHEVLIGDSVEIDERETPYIARFDGTLWRVLDPPPAEGAVASLVESAGPVIWAVIRAPTGSSASDSLWRLQAGGDWDAWERVELSPVALPAEAAGGFAWDEATGTFAASPETAAGEYVPLPAVITRDAAGELWLVAQLALPDGSPAGRWVVLRTRPADSTLVLLDDAQVFAAQQDLLPRRAPRAGDATCPKVYVQLNTVPEDSSEPFAPELRAALTERPVAGALLGEVRSQGHRQVGLLLSLVDYEASKAAITALGTKLKLKPKASCGHPPLVRGWRPEPPP